MRPWLLRPPLLCRGRTSDFSGSDRVISTKSATLAPRRPGVVGLYLRMPMASLSPRPYQRPSADGSTEDVDPLALCKGDDRALRVLALTETGLGALALTNSVDRVDALDLDPEDRDDALLDLGLVGIRVHDERVLVLVDEPVALLGDDRLQQNVTRVGVRLAGDLRRALDDVGAHAWLPSSSSEP